MCGLASDGGAGEVLETDTRLVNFNIENLRTTIIYTKIRVLGNLAMSYENTATVLIVDDETDLAELFAAFLEPLYSVKTATSGREALSLADDTIDVILLDRRMPAMSGDEVLSKLRDRGITAQVAMLTGVQPSEHIVHMPFDDYLIKPVGRDDVIALVEVLLERANYDEQSQEYFRLAAKKAALEISNNTNTEGYATVVQRLDELRCKIDKSLDDIADRSRTSDIII